MRTWVFCLCTFLCASMVLPLFADEKASELVMRGNRLYEAGEYHKAELAYGDAQKLLPESSEISFDLGNVAYRKGDYDAAEEFFNKAGESAAASRELRKKSLYNLGNCAFMQGEKLLDSDLQKALDYYKLSILRYRDVIAKDDYDRLHGAGRGFKGDEDAKYNIEVARLKIKDILDKLKQEEEKRKEQQKEQEEFIKKLKEAAEKQEKIVEDTGEAGQQKEEGQDVSEAVKNLKEMQGENKKSTKELADELQQRIDAAQAQVKGNGQAQVSPDEKVLGAKESLKEAEIEEGTALEHLGNESLDEAKGNEEAALRGLRDALEKLTKPQASQPQPGGETEQKQQSQKNEQEQKKGQEEKNKEDKGENQGKMSSQEAQEELAKLRKQDAEQKKQNLENFLRRYPQYRPERREYEPVDKDW